MKSKTIKFLIKLLITLGVLVWFLYKSDIYKIFQSLKSISFNTIISVFCIFISAWVIKSLKWKLFLPQYPYIKLLKFNFIGQFYTLILPGQITGEVVKAYILGKEVKNAEQVFASVFIDKITGFIGLLLISLLGLLFIYEKFPSQIFWIFLSCIIICILTLLSIRLYYNLTLKYLILIKGKFSNFQNFINQIIQLLQAWHTYTKAHIKILFAILLGAFFQFHAVIIIMELAMELDIMLPLPYWCCIFGIVAIALLLPLTIGGLGIREGTFICLLGWLGIAKEQALALSFSMFGLAIIGAIIGGIMELLRNYPTKKWKLKL